MNILEFIRKNSILVVIVIVGIALGLIMSEYNRKDGSLAGDYMLGTSGRNYNQADVEQLSSYAKHFTSELISAYPDRLRTQLDSDGDGKLTDTEQDAFEARFTLNTAAQRNMQEIEKIYTLWQYGTTGIPSLNIATNRAIIEAEGEALGLIPSKEQIDAYIKSMPAFQNEDGSFDQKLYQRLSGFNGTTTDQVRERAFRRFISDLMVWQAIEHLLTQGMQLDDRMAATLLNASLQDIQLKTAWLAASSIPTVAEPSEEELKAYWEENKMRYLSKAQRRASLYTLTPAEGISIEELYATTEQIMQTIAESNQADIDTLLSQAAQNTEYAPFTFKGADGSSHQSFEAFTSDTIPAALAMELQSEKGSTTLGGLAFEIEAAPSFEAHDEQKKSGQSVRSNIKQLRGFFPTPEGTFALLRVDAQLAPSVLEYEAAKEMAKSDLIAERQEQALLTAAEKLEADMKKKLTQDGADKAFELATAAGAIVEDYGPVNPETPTGLPIGMNAAALYAVPSGSFAPLSIIPTQGARISLVLSRSYTDSPELTAVRNSILLPELNKEFREKLILDWLHQSYRKFQVEYNTEAVKAQQ